MGIQKTLPAVAHKSTWSLCKQLEQRLDVGSEITEVTRRSIIDYFSSIPIDWAGRLPEDEFLSRLYNLSNLPSTDHRFKDAAGDIRQHRMGFLDWSDDWIFFDPRFELVRASDEDFLRFLCETVHPVVRPDSDEAKTIVEYFNTQLRHDGWELFQKPDISGRPVFGARKIGQRTQVFDEATGWNKVDRQIQEARLRLDTASNEEQFQAIGLICREVIITLAQTVYDSERHALNDGKFTSKTDAARMLEGYFKAELSGGINEEARSHAKAALKLSIALQHKRTADFEMAALCAEATAAVVNIVAILSGRRS
jgi:hypothetical protein